MWGKRETEARCTLWCKCKNYKPVERELPCGLGKYKPGDLVECDPSGVVIIKRYVHNVGKGIDGYYVKSAAPQYKDDTFEWFIPESDIRPVSPLPYEVGDTVHYYKRGACGEVISIEGYGARWTYVKFPGDDKFLYKNGRPCLPKNLRLVKKYEPFVQCCKPCEPKYHSCASVCPLLRTIPCYNPERCIPLFSGKIVCVGHNECFAQEYPIGMVVKICCGKIVGFENGSINSKDYMESFDYTYESFGAFCKMHASGTWVEVK